VKREPSFLYVGQWDASFWTTLDLEHDHFGAVTAFDCRDLAFESSALRRAEDVRPFPNEPLPIAR
jgi:hypothetical protein